MNDKKEIVKIEEKKAKPLSEFASSTASDIADETKKRVLDVSTKFFEIGYLLNLIKNKVYSMEAPFRKYESVYDWAEKELGFKRTTVKNLMAINATYSDHSVPAAEKYYSIIGNFSTTFSPVIAKKWKGYTQTALVEMLPMSEEERESISKETPVSEIRALKKKSEDNGQSTDQDNNTIIIDSEPGIEDLPETITVAEETLPISTKKLLDLKNVKERKAWIENCKEKSCYLWLDVPALNAKFYRYDFANGDYLLITEFRSNLSIANSYCSYQLIGDSKNYHVSKYWREWSLSINDLIDYLTKNRGTV